MPLKPVLCGAIEILKVYTVFFTGYIGRYFLSLMNKVVKIERLFLNEKFAFKSVAHLQLSLFGMDY